MNINATLFAQAIVFAILVWFTMKFVWPPIAKALDERAQKISEGLAAAEKAKTELAVANKRVEDALVQSRNESAARLADAEPRAQAMRGGLGGRRRRAGVAVRFKAKSASSACPISATSS